MLTPFIDICILRENSSESDKGTFIEYPFNNVSTQLRLKQRRTNKILLLQFDDLEDALLWKKHLAIHVAFYDEKPS